MLLFKVNIYQFPQYPSWELNAHPAIMLTTWLSLPIKWASYVGYSKLESFHTESQFPLWNNIYEASLLSLNSHNYVVKLHRRGYAKLAYVVCFGA